MTPPSAPSKRPRAPLVAALVLLLAILAGGLAGIALDRLVLLPRMIHRPGFEHGMRRSPPRDREFRSRFAREVGLTPQQQIRIDSIMDRQGREVRAVRGQVQPQLDSIIQRTRREVDAVLTPEQRQKAAEIRRRHPRRPGPPPGDFHPEPPGGPPPARPPQ
jgi:Spy/CpxP family protein refolding chaperone